MKETVTTENEKVKSNNQSIDQQVTSTFGLGPRSSWRGAASFDFSGAASHLDAADAGRRTSRNRLPVTIGHGTTLHDAVTLFRSNERACACVR